MIGLVSDRPPRFTTSPLEGCMSRSADCRGADRRANPRGVPLELVIGRETIRVWLDDAGIHFRHSDGPPPEGHLPWSVGIAMSLIPADSPRMGTIEAA